MTPRDVILVEDPTTATTYLEVYGHRFELGPHLSRDQIDDQIAVHVGWLIRQYLPCPYKLPATRPHAKQPNHSKDPRVAPRP